MSKFDILEQFSNEELKQILRRRGEENRYEILIDGVKIKSGHIYQGNFVHGNFHFHNVSDKDVTIKIEIEKNKQ